MSKYVVTGTYKGQASGNSDTLEHTDLDDAVSDFKHMLNIGATNLSLTLIEPEPEPEKTIQDVLADAPQGTMYYYTAAATLDRVDRWKGTPIIVSPGMYHYNGQVKPISESGDADNPETKLAKNWTIKYPS